uniref:Uncharacterized protein n=1 Tax=Schistosoma mansoni TaxID=6183 RepID=A0A913KVN3_SCHMA
MHHSVLFEVILISFLFHKSIQTDINSEYLLKAKRELIIRENDLLKYQIEDIIYYDELISNYVL